MELSKYHKTDMNFVWKDRGLNMEKFEEIYKRYINCSKCELCGYEFKKTFERKMEHDHNTGDFRNVVCHSCNQRKYDIKVRKHSKSGIKYIRFKYNAYEFRIKSQLLFRYKDLDKVIEFRDKWLEDNNYIT